MNHVIHLPEYGFLGISGKDAIKFFQGYTTCELNDLNETQSGIGATCNLKGRMLASYRLISTPDGLLIRMDRGLVGPMIEFLKKYIVFSKATLEDLSDRFSCYGQIIDHSDSTNTDNTAITGLSGKDEWTSTENGLVVSVTANPASSVKNLQDDNSTPKRYELWHDSKKNQSVPDGAPNITSRELADIWHQAEINQGLAWVTIETSEEYIPQMFNYDKINAVNFEKGCYLGQEIVARMQYRGAAKRKLYRASTTNSVKTGDTLTDSEGRNNGTIVSASSASFLAVITAKTKDDAKEEDNRPTSLELQLSGGDRTLLSPVI